MPDNSFLVLFDSRHVHLTASEKCDVVMLAGLHHSPCSVPLERGNSVPSSEWSRDKRAVIHKDKSPRAVVISHSEHRTVATQCLKFLRVEFMGGICGHTRPVYEYSIDDEPVECQVAARVTSGCERRKGRDITTRKTGEPIMENNKRGTRLECEITSFPTRCCANRVSDVCLLRRLIFCTRASRFGSQPGFPIPVYIPVRNWPNSEARAGNSPNGNKEVNSWGSEVIVFHCSTLNYCLSRSPPPFTRLLKHEVIDVTMEQCRNERAGETGDPQENPPTSGIVRHGSHMRKSASEPGLLRRTITNGGGFTWSDFVTPGNRNQNGWARNRTRPASCHCANPCGNFAEDLNGDDYQEPAHRAPSGELREKTIMALPISDLKHLLAVLKNERAIYHATCDLGEPTAPFPPTAVPSPPADETSQEANPTGIKKKGAGAKRLVLNTPGEKRGRFRFSRPVFISAARSLQGVQGTSSDSATIPKTLKTEVMCNEESSSAKLQLRASGSVSITREFIDQSDLSYSCIFEKHLMMGLLGTLEAMHGELSSFFKAGSLPQHNIVANMFVSVACGELLQGSAMVINSRYMHRDRTAMSKHQFTLQHFTTRLLFVSQRECAMASIRAGFATISLNTV
ncbi:hypothetical protein PR048_010252 [Dryococelus australis]|uniref:Uncharacterized protein n=1 Tax=Dryococelus australis TaxID=614101 RepID=A0ABQ9I286_9NEOP|nr:hypothetical protein PR048_010252 [Dryococelus australis]